MPLLVHGAHASSLAHMLVAAVILVIGIFLVLATAAVAHPSDNRHSSERKKRDSVQRVCVWAALMLHSCAMLIC